MVQRRVARFVKGRYGMYESVTQMLEELTWVPLSKRRENACLILFYKIINNLAMVPHSCLEKADGRTRKKHNLKFRHIGYNVDPYPSIAHCTRLCTLNQIPLHTLSNTHIIFLTCYINRYISFNELYIVCIICCKDTSNGCTQIISCSVTRFYYKFAILVNNL